MTQPDAVPLARLFAMAFRLLIDGLHEQLAARGWAEHPPAFGFVLLALRGGPAGLRDLTATLGTTKQAVSKLVDGMVEAGYAERSVDPVDARAKQVQLTDRGHKLLGAVEDIYRHLEAGWAQVLGAESVETLRGDLETMLRAAHGGELPAVRPTT